MYCEKCGKNNPEGATFCEECGAELNNAQNAAEETTYETPAAPAENENSRKVKIVASAVACIAIVALLIWCITGFVSCITGGGYEKPIKVAVEMQNKKEFKDKDAEKYMEILPEYQVKALEKQYKETDKDYEETLLDNFETSRENLEDTYGDNAKVSYKILDKTKLTDDEIDDIEDSIKSNYDKKVDVKEGYKCFVKYTKKGKEDESVSYTTRTVIKVDGKWCAWNA